MKRPLRNRIADLVAIADRALPLGSKLLIPFIVIASLLAGGIVWTEYRLQREEINDGYIQQGQILGRAFASGLTEDEHLGHLDDAAELKRSYPGRHEP